MRRLVLKIIKFINRDITITHHFTKEKFHLNLYRHKGYWYYGKNREKDTLAAFFKLIKAGDSVVEVGGHIGYLSLLFSRLIGDKGKLVIFEPGENNLPYLKLNIKDHNNIELVEKGAGDENKISAFYLEDLTGQNNSFLEDYSVFNENNASAINTALKRKVEVEMITLDSFLAAQAPDFIKIDVEGFELEVLGGGQRIIHEASTIFMIEITMNHEKIYQMFNNGKYRILTDRLNVISSLDEFCSEKYANRFFIPLNRKFNF